MIMERDRMSHPTQSYDCIVLGTGGVGSAALYHLAQRGARVLGIDRFPPGHDRGSSHGDTRVIRLAYFEHPDYVPLLQRAYTHWEAIEQARPESLYVQTGILEMGREDGEIGPGVLKAARQHHLEVETLSGAEIEKRYAGLRLPEPMIGVLETRGGFLRVEACVKAFADEAVKRGAQLQTGETVLGWSPDGQGITVETDRGCYRAGRLVVTAGAWAPQLLASLGVNFRVLRKPLLWYRTHTQDYRLDHGFPVWFLETHWGDIYGFPEIDDRGFKLAEHSSGTEVADPLQPDRALWPDDRRPLEALIRTHFPGVTSDCLHHAVCMYTMSPDGHFIIDRHPDDQRICFVAGLSGHGFKFASVLGEIMSDLSLDGETEMPIEFLSLERLQTQIRASGQ
jgi:sarcosine oxidase